MSGGGVGSDRGALETRELFVHDEQPGGDSE